jgi:uncharacterized protein DUF5919
LQQDFNSFLINLIAAFVYSLLYWAAAKLFKNNLRFRKYRLLVFGCAWLILNIIFFKYFQRAAVLFLILTSLAQGWFVFKELDQFWTIGLAGADKQTKTGIGYEQSLKLCTTSLQFLGIGAGKLLNYKSEFEQAIDRCNRPGSPIRFLLCQPDSKELKNIAKSANKDELSYQRIVLETVRELARLKHERAKNIEVRFYKEFPSFRLMFINNELCLASHYMLGKGGDGSDAPQMHLVKESSSRDIESLFYGFQEYFERIWDSSTEWDWTGYLEAKK